MARGDLKKKQDELEQLQARQKPFAVILFLVATVTAVSALAGSAVGLPRGLHVYLTPVLLVLVLIRLPTNLRMAKLAKEIKAAKDES